ncbi:MAG: T9SS type A sorting domain-containing protein [Ignavibacteria bacterium]|nr:T9SS type A sorting domain-containing protein [Ignavibacteria bacterium]
MLNGINGNIIFDYSFGTTLSQRGDRAAVLNDIDSNGVNEFLGGNREGRVICFYGGNGTITSVSNEIFHQTDFKLYQNYPNPFNPKTIINYELRNPGFVSLKIYNIKGEVIDIPVNKKQIAGKYEIEFSASDISSGIYFYSLFSGTNRIDTKRMIILK